MFKIELRLSYHLFSFLAISLLGFAPNVHAGLMLNAGCNTSVDEVYITSSPIHAHSDCAVVTNVPLTDRAGDNAATSVSVTFSGYGIH